MQRPSPLPPADPPPSVNEKILFVDDTPEVLLCFERSLGADYQITTAVGAAAGLEALRARGPFAVIVTDYEMPDMKGTEFLSRVHESWPDTVGIMLTGVLDIEIAIHALHEGRILRFLEKPCPQETLRAALDAALAQYRLVVGARQNEGKLKFTRDALCDLNAALSSRISEQTAALKRLHSFVSELNGADSREEIAERTARASHELCNGRSVCVELWDSEGSDLEVARAGGELGTVSHVEEIRTQEGALGCIRIDDRSKRQRGLSSIERSLLSSIASSAAVAVHNQVRRAERDEAQQATILALARLAEQRDNETGKHLERVSQYCKLVAEGLRGEGHYRDVITEEWVKDLVRSAPLHDIGKVGVPDAILLKPGKLTPAEWVIMKRHAEIGAQTLRSVMTGSDKHRFLQMSLEITWCHHEKWDGSGYPRGLAGEQIPLSARILALADVYDALTSERPYKEAWTHERSVEWILSGSGSHFDPRIVSAFRANLQEADQIRRTLADTPEDLRKLEQFAVA
jgi:response regulator RpfG family c-di-GMP phosphodiesterase